MCVFSSPSCVKNNAHEKRDKATKKNRVLISAICSHLFLSFKNQIVPPTSSPFLNSFNSFLLLLLHLYFLPKTLPFGFVEEDPFLLGVLFLPSSLSASSLEGSMRVSQKALTIARKPVFFLRVLTAPPRMAKAWG